MYLGNESGLVNDVHPDVELDRDVEGPTRERMSTAVPASAGQLFAWCHCRADRTSGVDIFGGEDNAGDRTAEGARDESSRPADSGANVEDVRPALHPELLAEANGGLAPADIQLVDWRKVGNGCRL
jgi:hypothetical protein